MKKQARWGSALLVTLFLQLMAGCSSLATPARRDIAMASAAMNQAETLHATQHAGFEMNLAKEKLASARAALAQKDYQMASALAKEAEVDARLAQGKANAAKAESIRNALRHDIYTLTAGNDPVGP